MNAGLSQHIPQMFVIERKISDLTKPNYDDGAWCIVIFAIFESILNENHWCRSNLNNSKDMNQRMKYLFGHRLRCRAKPGNLNSKHPS